MSFLIITFFLCPFFNLDLPLQHGINDEVLLPERQCCHQLRKRIMEEGEPRPPKIKEEPEELCTSQEGEQLALKQETDSFMMTPGYEECDHSEPEPNPDPFLSQHSPVNESQDLDESRFKGTRSSANEELTPKEEHYSNMSDTDSVEDSPMSESRCNTNTGKESVMCDVCGKDFQFRSKLKNHYRTHTGERPYLCKMCDKTFRHRSALTLHMRIHTGEKPYLCETCGKSFRHIITLKTHVHTDEKPPSCETW